VAGGRHLRGAVHCRSRPGLRQPRLRGRTGVLPRELLVHTIKEYAPQRARRPASPAHRPITLPRASHQTLAAPAHDSRSPSAAAARMANRYARRRRLPDQLDELPRMGRSWDGGTAPRARGRELMPMSVCPADSVRGTLNADSAWAIVVAVARGHAQASLFVLVPPVLDRTCWVQRINPVSRLIWRTRPTTGAGVTLHA
jgi:hypothetical protein